MSPNLQNSSNFQKFQLDNLADFEKCCKTHIFLQRSVPIQPKTSKMCQKIGKFVSLSGPPYCSARSRSDSPPASSPAVRADDTCTPTKESIEKMFLKTVSEISGNFRKFGTTFCTSQYRFSYSENIREIPTNCHQH